MHMLRSASDILNDTVNKKINIAILNYLGEWWRSDSSRVFTFDIMRVMFLLEPNAESVTVELFAINY